MKSKSLKPFNFKLEFVNIYLLYSEAINFVEWVEKLNQNYTVATELVKKLLLIFSALGCISYKTDNIQLACWKQTKLFKLWSSCQHPYGCNKINLDWIFTDTLL